jgi:hypothetical protein
MKFNNGQFCSLGQLFYRGRCTIRTATLGLGWIIEAISRITPLIHSLIRLPFSYPITCSIIPLYGLLMVFFPTSILILFG